MARECRLDSAVAAGRVAFGGWIRSASDVAVSIMAGVGHDYLGVDCQHSMLTEADAARMLFGLIDTPLTTIVRVSENDAARIGRVLDAGVDGVIVPMVQDADEAARAVAACRFPPRGVRSSGAMPGVAREGRSALERRARCFVMIESALGLENMQTIVETDGLAGIYVGPADLSLGIGCEWSLTDPPREAVEAMRAIAEACERVGILAGTHAGRGDAAGWLVELGYRMITLGVDTALLEQGAANELAIARRTTSGTTR
jgi:2-keto-3-deoxy-L-rhamnonate aldolase RhmA